MVDAREAIAEGRRVQPDLPLALMQDYLGISRPDVDARRNTALRQRKFGDSNCILRSKNGITYRLAFR